MGDAPPGRTMRPRRPLLWFFALAFAISWLGVLLAEARDEPVLWFVAMLLGPSVASIGLIVARQDTRGLRALAQRMLRWRVGRWYATILIAPVVLVIVLAVAAQISPSFTPALLATDAPGTLIATALMVGIGAGLFEEVGWTAFATPRLLRRFTWFDAGLVIGIPWAVWHLLPDYLARGNSGLWIAHAIQWVIALAAFRVLMTFVYSRTRSLPLAILLHATFTGSQVLLWPYAAGSGGELIWYGLYGCALWLAVGALVVIDGRLTSVAASRSERARVLPGDAVVPYPSIAATHAITIDAPIDDVWFYVEEIGASHVSVGHVVPALPFSHDSFAVASREAPHDLVLAAPAEHGGAVSWEYFAEEQADGATRLIVRGRVARSWKHLAHPREPGVGARMRRLWARLLDAITRPIARLGHRLLEAHHLRGIKRELEAIG